MRLGVLWLWASLLSLSVCLAAPALALEVPPLAGRVNDRANVLSEPVRDRLDRRLRAYETETGHQLAVLIVSSLAGDSLEDFSIRTVEAWQLGSGQRDDGVLLLVALAERRMRIEVGYGLEGELPDALAGRIVRERMAPAFRRGDYARGVEDAVEAIIAATGGSATPRPLESSDPGSDGDDPSAGGRWVSGLVVLLHWLAVLGMLWLGFRRRRWSGGASSVFWGASSRSSGGSRGGRSGGGGGFGGGGGGFGGGGASGSW